MINRLQRILPKLHTPRPRVVAGIVLVLCNRIMDPVSSGGLFVSADPVPPYYHGPSTQPAVVATASSRLPAPIDEPWLPAFATFDSSRHHPHRTVSTPLLPDPSVGEPNVGASPVVGDPQTSSSPTLPSIVPPTAVSQTPNVGEPGSYPIIRAPPAAPHIPTVGSSPNPGSIPPLTGISPPYSVGNPLSVGSSPVVSAFPGVGSSPILNQSPSVGNSLPPVVQTPVVSASQPITAPEPTGLVWLVAGLPLLRRNRSGSR